MSIMKDMIARLKILLFFLFLYQTSVLAGEADVIDVKIFKKGMNIYDFAVTLRHEDADWKHYANRWEVLDKSGKVLATRTIHHPHVNEQPFTRSLSGVVISPEIKRVTIRAHDSVHEYGGKTMNVELPLQ
jgi:hypothetical protein